MTFPSVRSFATSQTAASSGHTPTMPATIEVGDLLMAVAQINNNADLNSTTGYSALYAEASAQALATYVRVATDDSNDTISFNTTTTAGIVWVVLAIQDWEGTLTGVEGSFLDSDDPPSLSPSWGSDDNLWLVAAGAAGGTLPTVSAWSTSFTEVAQRTADFSADIVAGVAERDLAASTLDPDTVTFSGSPTTFRIATIAVQPGAGAAPVTGGSEATVTVDSEGAGRKVAYGGSTATVTASSEGAGTKHATGGSEADITVDVEGAGQKHARGGNETTVTVTATGAGHAVDVISGGSESNVTVAATGGGRKVAYGASETTVTVAVESAGFKRGIGASESNLMVDAEGAGTKHTAAGSVATVTVDTEGAGQKHAYGGSGTNVTVDATGAGGNPANDVDITVTVAPPTTHWAVSAPTTRWTVGRPEIT